MNISNMNAGIFASRHLTVHLARGVTAIFLLSFALRAESTTPLLALAAVVGAFVLFRGCPVCWTLGLVETIKNIRSARTDRKTA